MGEHKFNHNGPAEPTVRERILLVPVPLDKYLSALFTRATQEIPDQTTKSEHDFLLAMLLNGGRIMEAGLNEMKQKKSLIVAPDAPLPKAAGEFMNKVSNQWRPITSE